MQNTRIVEPSQSCDSASRPAFADTGNAPLPPSARDQAKTLAQRYGFRVFRVPPNVKFPPYKGWQSEATSDPAKVHALWTDPVTGESTTDNIGILTGNGLFVLDVDVRDGKRGDESLQALVDLGLDIKTLTSITPTGGRHLLYRCPPDADISSGANKLGDGLDVKGRGSYVVGVGSVLPSGEYDWYEADAPMLDAADWLVRMCRSSHRAGSADADSTEPLVDLDQEDAIRRAIEWLKTGAPEAVEGAGGDQTTYQVAARVKDFGISEPKCLDLMLDHWNETKALPNWDPDDLERKVANAYAYGRSPPGIASAQAEFDEVEIDDAPGQERDGGAPADSGASAGASAQSDEPNDGASKADGANKTYDEGRKSDDGASKNAGGFKNYDFADARTADTTCRYLVKGLIDENTLAVMYGAPNTGKSFVALALAHAIATGRKLQGRRVKRGLVVYIAMEGPAGFRLRNAAIHACAPLAENERAALNIVADRFNLTSPGHIGAVVKHVREAEQRHNARCALVVVDTLAKAAPGIDENAFQGMSAAVNGAEAIQRALDCTVLLVHHSGKNPNQGARGHSALRGAVDTELHVEKDEAGRRTVHVEKQRDGTVSQSLRFNLRRVPLGTDEDGDPVASCIVEWVTASEFEPLPLSPAAEAMWEAFQIAAKDIGGIANWRTATVSTDAWERSYIEMKSEGAGDSTIVAAKSAAIRGTSAKTLRRLRTTVMESGHVRKISTSQWVAA